MTDAARELAKQAATAAFSAALLQVFTVAHTEIASVHSMSDADIAVKNSRRGVELAVMVFDEHVKTIEAMKA